MKKKLELRSLNVESFVTNFNGVQRQTANLKGGTGMSVQILCDGPNTESCGICLTPTFVSCGNCPSDTCPPPSNGCTVTIIQQQCPDSRMELCNGPA